LPGVPRSLALVSVGLTMAARATPEFAVHAPLVPPRRQALVERGKRVALGFGPRFYLLLLLGMIWLAPAWWNARFLYGLLAWDVFVFALWGWDFARLPHPGELNVERVWDTPAAFGTRSHVALELSNHGALPIYAKLVDDVPVALAALPPEIEIAAPARQAARARAQLRGRGAYEILPAERGDAHFGGAIIRYQSALRIAERWASADLAQTVRVYPNFEQSRKAMLYLIRTRQVQLERRLRRRRGQGREFESLREYRPGDEYRDICWTATARRAHLVTKIYQLERSQAVWIILDAGRLLRARVAGPSKLDYAVNAALSLAQVAMYSGDRVGLLAYGRHLQQDIAPARGAAQLRALVEALALVHAEPYEANHLRASSRLLSEQKRRSLVVWITDFAETPATPEVVEGALQLAGRHLVIFGAIAQPELAEVGRAVPHTAAEMYEHAAAVELLERRELLMRRMRQQGILALELTPGALSTALINHYLETKDRGLL
jgi:uncharacterized protein (DUF58 family)